MKTDLKTLRLTEDEINYVWHVLDNLKGELTGEESDANTFCDVFNKFQDAREGADIAEPEIILLTHEEIAVGYHRLQEGDFISVGDLFRRYTATPNTGNGKGKLTRFRFERVTEDTTVRGHKFVGLLYLPSYPVVIRPRSNTPAEARPL